MADVRASHEKTGLSVIFGSGMVQESTTRCAAIATLQATLVTFLHLVCRAATDV
jgi:hypothetical protein